MDGFSGYNQVVIAEADQDKTAFVSQWGTFKYTKMPFGLKNAPSTFQRIITSVFSEYLTTFMRAFLDDFSCMNGAAASPKELSFHEHVYLLSLCFQKCRQSSLKLNPLKCEFFVTTGTLLGHIISHIGLAPDPEKILPILRLHPPSTPKAVKSFLGHAGYHRKFIRNYAQIAAPLTELLQRDAPFHWGPRQQEAFDTLKTALTTMPILTQPDWNRPFHVHTDASNLAIGAVLAQPEIGGPLDLPVFFTSRQLNSAERNYSTTEREGLAIVFALHKFRHYLLATHFTIITDHQPLKYLLNKTQVSGRIQRWLLLFQEFDFEILVRPGRDNIIADHLSRIEHGDPSLSGVPDDLPDSQLP